MIEYNIPAIHDCAQQIATCKTLTAEVAAEAAKLKGMTETHFQGGGGEAFRENYTQAITLVDALSGKLNEAERALLTGADGMVAKDGAIKAQYV
ncbi:MAG: hypothetical protein HYZ38_16040 [Mycobacterium sp.]|nr:hypothetical protein [Mycobacterium sp.]